MSITYTDRFYTSDLFYKNIRDLLITYPFLQSENIGFSVLEISIPLLFMPMNLLPLIFL